MTNLSIEILFWIILISYLGLRFSQTWHGFKQQYWIGGKNETTNSIHRSTQTVKRSGLCQENRNFRRNFKEKM